MKAVVCRGPGEFDVCEVPDPWEPGPNEVLLKPLCVVLCFADVRAQQGFNKSIHRPNVVIGHEICAEVLAVSDAALSVGDRVVVDPRTYCGRCDMCRAGIFSACQVTGGGWMGTSGVHEDGSPINGGLADYLVVPGYACHRLAKGATTLAGAFIESLAAGTRIARYSDVRPGDEVVFFGLDDYSAGALQWVARSAGAVIVVDPFAERRRVALELGATEVVDPSATDCLSAIRDLFPKGADHVFVSREDFVEPSQYYLENAAEAARIQGSIHITRLSCSDEDLRYPMKRANVKELTVRNYALFFCDESAQGGRARGDYAVTLAGIASGRINGAAYVNRQVSFGELTPALLEEISAASIETGLKSAVVFP